MARTGDHRKRARRLSVLFTAVIAVAATLALTGCPKKGPAEKAGEKIDAAKDKVSDTLNPKGPAEKAGRSIDRATDK
jgi:predicted small lipoprotein YifL